MEPTEQPWHAAFPNPTSVPAQVSKEELHAMIKAASTSPSTPADFLVVDVRRTDFEIGFIKGAINLPAHSMYPTLPSLVPVLSRYPRVIFHCQSSLGRGTRSAAWYQDALDAAGITSSRAEILTGGIKGWIAAYGNDPEFTTPLEGGI